MNRIAGLASILLLASLFRSGAAFAAVTREGAWPDADKPISVDASGLSRSEAVKRIADAAGWNVVVHAPPGDPIDIHVKNQPAAKVLDLVLNDASYVAHRDGTLIDIQRTGATPSAAAAPEAAPAPVAPPPVIAIAPPPPALPAIPPSPMPPPIAAPAATTRGEDRVVTGGSLRIEKNETVNDVTVYGGSVDVYGTVTGDMVVTGGSARIHEGGHVVGDATTVGGSLNVEDGATVDGDVGVVGGILKRAEGSKIGGKVVTGAKEDDSIRVKVENGESHENRNKLGAKITEWTRDAGGAVTRTALLFVFGAVLLALGASRMDALRAEIAVRPMRSFALGIVGGLAGIVAVTLLCITVIGIPVAVVGLLCAVFGVYAGICAALTTAGEALTAHKTKNPYAHLAVGCALFFVIGIIPVIGGLMHAAIALIGIGVLVATRGAGLIKVRTPGQGPYRTADSI